MDEQSIFYTPRLGAPADEEAAILARVYRLVLDAHARRRAAGLGSSSETKGEGQDGSESEDE